MTQAGNPTRHSLWLVLCAVFALAMIGNVLSNHADNESLGIIELPETSSWEELPENLDPVDGDPLLTGVYECTPVRVLSKLTMTTAPRISSAAYPPATVHGPPAQHSNIA